MRIPARIYAVTFGSRASLVSRVIRKPENSISATEMITPATGLALAISADRFVSSPHFILVNALYHRSWKSASIPDAAKFLGIFREVRRKGLQTGRGTDTIYNKSMQGRDGV